MNSITPFATEVFEEVVRHMESISLVHQQQNESEQSEILGKLMLLGMEEQRISKLIEPWHVLQIKPDFIFCARIFRKGSIYA